MLADKFVGHSEDKRVFNIKEFVVPMLDSCVTCEHYRKMGHMCEQSTYTEDGTQANFFQVIGWRCRAYVRKDQSIIQ